MELNATDELIEDIRQGRMVILMDDEDRENEGDLIMAASAVRTEDINFMARNACGLVCLTLTEDRCRQLQLPLMVDRNRTRYSTNFTVSIEAAEGVTTGISAADRARTVQAAVSPTARPEDIVQPGHIFPIMAQPGGVLTRAGHTEAGCDLARLAGFEPAAVIVEIMNSDGTMARRPELEVFAQTHGIKIGTIADLIHYRMLNEQTVRRISEHRVETAYGEFRFYAYRDEISGEVHFALAMGEVATDEPVLVRVQQTDTLRDILQVHRPGPHSWSVHEALTRIAAEQRGVLVLIAPSETTDSILQQLKWLGGEGKRNDTHQRQNVIFTVGAGSQILRELGVRSMRLMSSPVKYNAISGFDLKVSEYVDIGAPDPS